MAYFRWVIAIGKTWEKLIGENFLLNKQPTYQYYKYSLETQKVLELDNPM